MIGLDTNVIVRYLVQDEPNQSAHAGAVIDALTDTEPGFLSLVTVVEVYWVLRRAYKLGADRCAELIGGLVDARELRVGHDSTVRVALAAVNGGTDFADAVIAELGRDAACTHTVTFDRRAARLPGMRLLTLHLAPATPPTDTCT